jgi:hypothetical protein
LNHCRHICHSGVKDTANNIDKVLDMVTTRTWARHGNGNGHGHAMRIDWKMDMDMKMETDKDTDMGMDMDIDIYSAEQNFFKYQNAGHSRKQSVWYRTVKN